MAGLPSPRRARILPHLEHRKLTSLTPPELREWLVEFVEYGEWAPKTLNNALKALAVCLNHTVADGLLTANPAAYVRALPLGHIERDYLRLHEITAYLDGCSETYASMTVAISAALTSSESS